MSVKEVVRNSPFVAADGTWLAGGKETHIFALTLDTGEVTSVFSSKGMPTSELLVPLQPPAEIDLAGELSSGTLIMGRSDYAVHAFDPKSGEQLWNVTAAEYVIDCSE